jgi:putative polyhydroxyalkanoate system protein
MSHINIRREHQLDHEHARRSAEQVAQHLNEQFNLDYRWEGDVLHFRRSGVDGSLVVSEGQVAVQAKLGLLLRPLRGRFEEEIHRYLDDLFDTA